MPTSPATEALLKSLTHSLCSTMDATFVVEDFEVVPSEDGTCVVLFTEKRAKERTSSPPFPNKKLACEWASDHLYLCGW
jgi:hypothetical protein